VEKLLQLARAEAGIALSRLSRRLVQPLVRRTSGQWDDALVERISSPLSIAFAVGFGYLLLPLLGLYAPAHTFALRALRAVFIGNFFWGLARSVDVDGAPYIRYSRYCRINPNDADYNRGAYLAVGFLCGRRLSWHEAANCIDLTSEIYGRLKAHIGPQNQVVVGAASYGAGWARYGPPAMTGGVSGAIFNAGNGCVAADYAGITPGAVAIAQAGEQTDRQIEPADEVRERAAAAHRRSVGHARHRHEAARGLRHDVVGREAGARPGRATGSSRSSSARTPRSRVGQLVEGRSAASSSDSAAR